MANSADSTDRRSGNPDTDHYDRVLALAYASAIYMVRAAARH